MARILGLVCALLLAACAPEPIDPSPQGVYRAKCARCHEVDGSSTTASRQADRPVDLRTPAFQREFSDERIREVALDGTGRMEGVRGLTGDHLDSLVLYIRSLAQPEARP